MRRYAPIAPSKGTVWPPDVRDAAYARDRGCLGPRAGMPGPCQGEVELDHVRGSGALGKKSPSILENAASLCGAHHRLKTNEGRTWRPHLIELVTRLTWGDCGHVEPIHGCLVCLRRAVVA